MKPEDECPSCEGEPMCPTNLDTHHEEQETCWLYKLDLGALVAGTK